MHITNRILKKKKKFICFSCYSRRKTQKKIIDFSNVRKIEYTEI